MAIANYQIPTKLTFFPSYLQYAYAAGLIKGVDYRSLGGNLTDEDIYKLVVLDPSHTSKFEFEHNDFLAFNLKNPTWNFDFGMILGHDIKSAQNNWSGIKLKPSTFNFFEGEAGGDDAMETDGIVNWSNASVDYNGWSAFDVTSLPDDRSGVGLKVRGENPFLTGEEGTVNLGSLSFGKSWTAPQNVDLNVKLNYNYGYKQKKTIGGKTISQMNYYKQSKWLLNAWELSDVRSDTRTEPTESRNGLRTWSVSWSFLQDKYAMSQNNMNNSNNWTVDSDSEYPTGADGTSLYNAVDSIDFYTSVIKPTMGGHLPVVIRISESNNSDQWAIVRIKKYSISQKSPKFIDVKLTLEEQV